MLHVLHVVGKMDKGGIETFVMNILRNNDESVCMDVLCTMPGEGDYEKEIAELGVQLHHLGDSCHEDLGYLRYCAQYRDYMSWFSAHRYDIVHIHGSHAFDLWIEYKACINAGHKNVIIHSHTTSGLHPFLNRIFSKLLARSQAKLLACSNAAGEWLFGQKATWTLIRNGIDLERFRFSEKDRKEIRTKLGIPAEAVVIAHTGRFVPLKNQKFIIRLLGCMADSETYAILVGSGEELENVKKLVSEMELENRVFFTGSIPDVERYLSASDYYVMPSLYEGLPLACIEAQANGLACLFSTGISSEVLVLDNARFFELEDEVSGCLQELESMRLLEDRTRATIAVKNAGYDIGLTSKQLIGIYKKMASNGL